MGDSKVKKGELHDFARKLGAKLAEHDQRMYSLALAFDCLVTVMGKETEVKAELEKRKKEIDERMARQANKPPVSVP